MNGWTIDEIYEGQIVFMEDIIKKSSHGKEDEWFYS